MQGKSCYFSPDRVECRQDNGFRSVVNNYLNPCSCLKSTYVSSFASDDPSLHFIWFYMEDCHRIFDCIFCSHSLDSLDNDPFCFLVCSHFGLIKYFIDIGHCACLCFFPERLDQVVLCFSAERPDICSSCSTCWRWNFVNSSFSFFDQFHLGVKVLTNGISLIAFPLSLLNFLVKSEFLLFYPVFGLSDPVVFLINNFFMFWFQLEESLFSLEYFFLSYNSASASASLIIRFLLFFRAVCQIRRVIPKPATSATAARVIVSQPGNVLLIVSLCLVFSICKIKNPQSSSAFIKPHILMVGASNPLWTSTVAPERDPRLSGAAACSRWTKSSSKVLTVEFQKWMKNDAGNFIAILKNAVTLLFQALNRFSESAR